jgi:probable phosphoglycerate mutase
LKLYLLRHGETEFSRGDRFCGHIDAPLTAAGVRMGERFADAYGGQRWQAVVTSTRRRTLATAAPLAARAGLPILRDDRLDEMFFGEWQGLTKREAALRDPVRYGRWHQDPMVGAPGGESPHDVLSRAIAAIDDLRARHESGDVLVVSHKTVLRLLLCRLLGVELRRYREWIDWPTGAVSVLELGPRHAAAYQIVDDGHLEHSKVAPHPRSAREGLFPAPVPPEAGGHLVGEQDARGSQLELSLVDDEPAGGDGALDFEITTDHGIDAMSGAVGGAVDPGGGA